MPYFELNLTAYGWGLGLVMAGWIAGFIVSIVFSVVRGISRVG